MTENNNASAAATPTATATAQPGAQHSSAATQPRTTDVSPEHNTATLKDTLKDPILVRSFMRMMSSTGRHDLRIALGLGVATGIADGAAMLTLLPIATALATDEPQMGLSLRAWLIIAAILAVLIMALRYFMSMRTYGAALDFLRQGHKNVGDAIAQLPLGWFRPANTGSLSRLVSEGIMSAGETIAHLGMFVITNACALVVITIGSWFWEARLGLTLTLVLVGAAIILVIAQALRRKFSQIVVPSDKELAGRIVEYAECQPAIRAAGRAEDFAPLEEAGQESDRARKKDLWLSMIPIVLNGMAMQALIVLVITAAAKLAVDGTLDPIPTIAFIGLSLRYVRNLEELGGLFVGVDMGRVPLDEMTAIMDTPRLPEPEHEAELPHPGEVRFEDVTFGYDPAVPVVRDLTFTVPPRSMTAIVGPSGSGKTTIARLTCRFWDVDSGRILVGGCDIREQPTSQLMAQLSMVFQDVYLFDDTLEANIRVGRESATDQEVRAAATEAGVDSIAAHLPQGWDTPTGEGGRSLSGGERQRVSVARALLKRAPIVLFDEATSALDAENEANIVASMETLKQTSTLIVIAHKLDTIRNADNIIVLDEHGRIVEEGRHEELYSAGGAYRAYWDRRAAAAGWHLA